MPKPPLVPPRAKSNVALSLEKEIALLGKKQVEAREVDLLFVDLDLSEIGVDGEVGGEIGGDAVLEIAADVRIDIVVDVAASADSIGGDARDRVRLDLDVLARRRQVEADQRAARRDRG